LCRSSGGGEVSKVVGGAARPALRPEGEAGDVADACPAEAFVETRRLAAGHRIEHKKCPTTLAGGRFGGLHQGRTDATAPDAAMHEKLRQISAVRLVLR
jgi:hypothetical protein